MLNDGVCLVKYETMTYNEGLSLIQLCHRVVDEICRGEPPSLVDYSDTWSLVEWLDLKDCLTSLLLKMVGDGSSDEQVK